MSDVIARTPAAPSDATTSAADRLVALQHADGSWQAEVVWSPIITAQAVITQAIAGRPADAERQRLILHHFARTQRPDGGWGLHPQSHSYVFVTTLVYIAARLLGASAEDDMVVRGRALLAATPNGILANPQWGRFWLSLVGLYDPRELNPCPPELFLLPRSSVLSPQQFYCHTRYIYLAMATLSGVSFGDRLGSIIDDLRRELPGADRMGAGVRAIPVAASDLHETPGLALRIAYAVTRPAGALWRALPAAARLRQRALDLCRERIRYEQRVTSMQGLSPVSGFLNVLALLAHDPDDPDAALSLEGAEFWCWRDETNGIRYAGARSTAWDTSFALQALAATAGTDPSRHAEAIRRGYDRLCAMQLTRDPPDREAQDRDINRGGWCFTDGGQAWPVSDCTAEAVVALLDCHALPGVIPPDRRISPERLAAAATFILSRRNADGGFGSYERRRGRAFLETLNPSEMFGRCMTELTYVECTASSIRALHRIAQTDVPLDHSAIEDAVRGGAAIIIARQDRDGSWPGFWGINRVYGTLFAVAGLREAGWPIEAPTFTSAQRWLEARQKDDGGWGEHFEGCVKGCYVDNPESLVITTAWGVLALTCCSDGVSATARRGRDWLAARQEADGDWPRDSVNGVFFGTAMLDYRLYNTYFPLMALAKLSRRADD